MLVYDDPPQASRPVAQTDRPAGGGYRLTVGGIAAALRRRALWIAACAILFSVTGLLVGKSLTPRYTAEAQLYIDPRDLQLVTKELTTGGQDSIAYQTVVESQARLITSSNVLRRVVETTGLLHDEEFVGHEAGGGLMAKIGAALGLGGQAPADADGDMSVAVDGLLRRVSVRRTGRTYIVDVAVWSRDAAKAARLANAVVASYLAEDAAARTESANRVNSGLTARLGELREALNGADTKVQAYRAKTGLVGTRDALVTDQQLTQLNSQLNAARGKVADAQARFDQVQRIENAGLDAGAIDDVLASQSIAALRTQYAELSRKQTELTNDLGPRHPLAMSIDKQVRQARRLIDQEVGRYVQAARTDLSRARAAAAALEKNFDQAKARTVGLAQASIRLRELEREAEASRSVYEAYLTRSRETGQQVFLDAGNARVVTAATKPLARSFPPPARILVGFGFVAGLGLGVLLALLDDWSRSGMPKPVRASRRAAAPPETVRPSPPASPSPGRRTRSLWSFFHDWRRSTAPRSTAPKPVRAFRAVDPPAPPDPPRPPVHRAHSPKPAVFSIAGAAAMAGGRR